MRTLPRRLAVLSLVATMTLAGCGGSSSDESSDSPDSGSTSATPEPTPEDAAGAATGDEITGTGYTYRVVDGWAAPDQNPAGTDSSAGDVEAAAGFKNNINVIKSAEPGAGGLDQLEDQLEESFDDTIEKEVPGADVTDTEIEDRTSIDGQEAAHASADLTASGAKIRIEQFYALRDGSAYIITFTFAASTPAAEREDVSESILASWKWAS